MVRSFSALSKSPLLLGAAAALIVNVIGAALVIVNHYLLARVLGADGLGLYSYAVSWVGLVALVSVLGVDSVVISQGSRLSAEPAQLRGLFAWAGRDVFLGTIISLVLYLSIVILKKWHLEVMVAAAPLIAFLAAGLLRQGMLRALKRPGLARFPDVVLRPALFGFLIVFTVLSGQSVGAGEALMLHAAAACVAFIVGVVLVRMIAPRSQQASSTPERVLGWRRSAHAFFLVTWAGVTFQELDMLVAGTFLPAHDAGLYATALRLAAFVPFGAQACDAALAPLIAEKYGKGESIAGLVRRAVGWNILFGLFPALLLILAGSSMLGVFGESFAQAATVLTILAAGQFVAILFGPSGFVLSMTNNQVELAKIYTTWTVAAVILGVAAVLVFHQIEALAGVMATCLVLRAAHGARVCSRKLAVDPTFVGLFKNY